MSESEREEMYARVLANMTEINISTVTSGVPINTIFIITRYPLGVWKQ